MMGKLGNGAQVRAHAVVGGVVHQHRLRIGVCGYRVLHLPYRHTKGNAKAVVGMGVDVNRRCAAQHQRVDYAAVYVARQYNLIPRAAGG